MFSNTIGQETLTHLQIKSHSIVSVDDNQMYMEMIRKKCCQTSQIIPNDFVDIVMVIAVNVWLEVIKD